jgi:tRNA (cytidine/uridine-2'-O-)-methyltransferase
LLIERPFITFVCSSRNCSAVLFALRASAHRFCLLFAQALIALAVIMLQVFRVMFFSPRIAPNTGNAIRMVAATGCELHLVQPLGFDLAEPKLRRAGLDYHDLASVTVHESLAAAWQAILPARVFAFTAHATTSFTEIGYQPGDVLLFGPEPTGLDAHTLADPAVTAAVRIPMISGRRSLNLSNAAAVAVYEAWRQQGFSGGV